MLRWIDEHQTILYILSGTSIAVLVASIFVIPLVVARIHPDYFSFDTRPDRSWINLPPTIRITIHVGKNLLGFVLMIAGLAMLALPGPGMVTRLIGFFLLDFPGKYRFEKWMVSRPLIHRPINWLRRRSGRSPLVLHRSFSAVQSLPSGVNLHMADDDVINMDERDEYTIRTFAEGDLAEVERLAREGLLIGHVDHSGSGTEADPHGSGAGRPTPQSFWVVEAQGSVIGSIAMLQGDGDVGRLLQLRIASEWKDDPRIAKMLVRAAVDCAKERGALKMAIDSPGFEPRISSGEESSIVQYLRSLGFEYTRTHEQGGRSMLEFYLNLYGGPQSTS